MSDNAKKTPSDPKNSKQDKTAEKAKKSGKFSRWLREMKVELKKVQWPSKKDTAKHTTTVICCVGLVGMFIWVYDLLATNVVDALIKLF